ncbi:ABC transporter ATP-binding protein [Thermodesulfobacteriota bacterium]
MLKVEEISAEYSGMEALQKVSMRVENGEFISLIGPNGAGKSTLLKSISGTVSCTSGGIFFEGKKITAMEAHKRTALGIIHVPEGRRIFPSLTVLENLELGAYRFGTLDAAGENFEFIFKLFPILQARQNQPGGTLSGGEQQMLAIGRGLMGDPQLFMLDEPSLGLSPLLSETIFEALKEIRAKVHTTILLVEQRAFEALELCDRGYILESGKITLSEDRKALMGNPKVQKAYLGGL